MWSRGERLLEPGPNQQGMCGHYIGPSVGPHDLLLLPCVCGLQVRGDRVNVLRREAGAAPGRDPTAGTGVPLAHHLHQVGGGECGRAGQSLEPCPRYRVAKEEKQAPLASRRETDCPATPKQRPVYACRLLAACMPLIDHLRCLPPCPLPPPLPLPLPLCPCLCWPLL